MRAPLLHLAGAAALATAAVPAFGHDGHAHTGLLAGLMHPLGGVDHLMATVGIGLVAGFAARARRTGPTATDAASRGIVARAGLAAALGLAAGAAWSLAAGTLPGLPSASGGLLEHAVAIGLLALAVALLAAERLGTRGLALLALAVLVPHGGLHAVEGGGAAFFAGLAASSALLFAIGTQVGAVLAARPGRRASNAARWVVAGGYAGTFVGLIGAGLR